MFLNYGYDKKNNLIAIEEVEKGITELVCPFCSEVLVAKKGDIYEHHFSHLKETCQESASIIKNTEIPFFDGIGISKNHLKILEKINRWHSFEKYWLSSKEQEELNTLIAAGLLYNRKNDKKKIDVTEVGKELVEYAKGYGLSLKRVATLQESMFTVRLKMLESIESESEHKASDFYKLRLMRILQQNLYTLKIKFIQNDICYPLMKVGLTSRSDINERVYEIEKNLLKHGEVEGIEEVQVYEHYGSLEKEILKRLKAHQFKIGNHKEYFFYSAAKLELKLLNLDDLGKRKTDSHQVKALYRDHASKVKTGQMNSILLSKTKSIGRPVKSIDKLLQDHSDIVEAYRQGASLRVASRQTSKAINTIIKVYKVLKSQEAT